MLNIAIVEDDPQAAGLLGSYLDRYAQERGTACNSVIFNDAVDFLTGPQMMAAGCRENLERLSGELLNKDWFMTFPDFQSYLKAREQAFLDYENRTAWAQKMLVNISQAGFFSSDRTIEEYNRDIWKLD